MMLKDQYSFGFFPQYPPQRLLAMVEGGFVLVYHALPRLENVIVCHLSLMTETVDSILCTRILNRTTDVRPADKKIGMLVLGIQF